MAVRVQPSENEPRVVVGDQSEHNGRVSTRGCCRRRRVHRSRARGLQRASRALLPRSYCFQDAVGASGSRAHARLDQVGKRWLSFHADEMAGGGRNGAYRMRRRPDTYEAWWHPGRSNRRVFWATWRTHARRADREVRGQYSPAAAVGIDVDGMPDTALQETGATFVRPFKECRITVGRTSAGTVRFSW